MGEKKYGEKKRLGPPSGFDPPDVQKRNRQEGIALSKTLANIQLERISMSKMIEREIKVHLCKHGHLLQPGIALKYGYEVMYLVWQVKIS